MSDLFIFSTPPQAVVTLTLDNTGKVISGEAGTFKGRSDAHRLSLPAGTPSQGASLKVSFEGHVPFQGRGVLVASNGGDAQFMFDDVHLVVNPKPAPTPIPIPTPTLSRDPGAIIDAVFATGQHSLATKEGCGKFTEACCAALHAVDPNWGHIRKTPPQNLFNGHAVDAIQLKDSVGHGIYDIILSSVSPGAKPTFNRVGDANPALWFFPA